MTILVSHFGFLFLASRSLDLYVCAFILEGSDGRRLKIIRLYHPHLTDTQACFSFTSVLGEEEKFEIT